MISGLDEVRACRKVVAEACENLRRDGIPFAGSIPVGVMIEVPAAVHMAEQLAGEVDFFALGTNDLVQYLLAADRNNPLVKKYYDPLHPAVLRVLQDMAKVTTLHGKGLCLCGEMASDPMNFLLLIGMGIREFSMPAPFIPRTKAFLRNLDLKTARKAAREALLLTDSAAIRTLLNKALAKLEPAS
jgi:phosphotransferase system enzyme I (PtsP)